MVGHYAARVAFPKNLKAVTNMQLKTFDFNVIWKQKYIKLADRWGH